MASNDSIKNLLTFHKKASLVIFLDWHIRPFNKTATTIYYFTILKEVRIS